MTTIGGVAFRHIDRLPEVGDEVVIHGVTLRVLSMSGHRIEQLWVGRGALEEQATEGGAEQ